MHFYVVHNCKPWILSIVTASLNMCFIPKSQSECLGGEVALPPGANRVNWCCPVLQNDWYHFRTVVQFTQFRNLFWFVTWWSIIDHSLLLTSAPVQASARPAGQVSPLGRSSRIVLSRHVGAYSPMRSCWYQFGGIITVLRSSIFWRLNLW